MRTAISDANVRKPQGRWRTAHRWQVQTNDELKTAADYQPLIVHYQNGAAVRLGDVATVSDSVGRTQRRDDQRQTGDPADDPQTGKPISFRQWTASAPACRSAADHSGGYRPADRPDRSPTIRASLEEVEQTLVISVALVILVVFLFLRSGRAMIPAVAVPVSLIGTFAAMYLCGFSLNNLSLMADHRHRLRGG
ncbi:oqxB_1_EU370913 [Klebsiella pneumoniae]|nr:oqxB_1_EU370913 [Klebsiella pneumoniae]